ncbi:hypothetical protein IJI17_01550 [Candidatus Saccharibacteria bacterium]|nr:hypothetical protein [Candidatus Saccharibacteria bacterium]
MRRVKAIMLGVMMALGLAMGVGAPVLATDPDPICDGLTGDLAEVAGCGNTTTAETVVGKVINVLLYAVGILAVVMIVWAGLTMTISAGNPQAVTRAKNIMIYAVAGLIIAVLAYAIVNFVVNKL